MRKISQKTKYDIVKEIACKFINCGSNEIEYICALETAHKGSLERAFEIKDEIPEIKNGVPSKSDFLSIFEEAVKETSLKEIQHDIIENDKKVFGEMVINTFFMGGVFLTVYGDKYNIYSYERQDIFADYVRGHISRKEFLIEYRKLLKKIETFEKPISFDIYNNNFSS